MALIDAYPTTDNQLTTHDEWEAFLNGLDATGIIPGAGNNFSATIQSGPRTVTLATGAALLRGFFTSGASNTIVNVPAAGVQDRIDRLVLRLDRAAVAANAWITPHIIQGTPATTPTVPAITTSPTGTYDLTICRWTSESDGSLTNLVDERYVIGPNTKIFKSTQRPVPAPADWCLGWEWDTHRVLFYSKITDTWTVLYEDSGDVALDLQNETVWGLPSSAHLSARLRSGWVQANLTIRRIGSAQSGSSADNDVGSLFTTFPDGMRPLVASYFPVILPGGLTARIRVETDGQAFVAMPSAPIPVGTILRTTITYQV